MAKNRAAFCCSLTYKNIVLNMQYPLISEYVKAIQDAGDNLAPDSCTG